MASHQILKWLATGLLSLALSACFGGTVAEQLARSVIMQGADKVTASALDAKERNDKLAVQQPYQSQATQSTQFQNIQSPNLDAPKSQPQLRYKDTPADPYRLAFINSAFETITPKAEPLPEKVTEEETPIQTIHETRLVQVEVWSLLVGEEKNRILEKARLQGYTSLPPKNEWQKWQLAIGAETNGAQTYDTETNGAQTNSAGTNQSGLGETAKNVQPLTFLIPPEIGKMHSGTKAIVELSNAGELNIARYAAN